MANSEQTRDKVSQRIQELGWTIEEGRDSREESDSIREVVSGSYQEYRLSVVFDDGEPGKVEIVFEDSSADHQHSRGTRRPWSVLKSLPTPEQVMEMRWER